MDRAERKVDVSDRFEKTAHSWRVVEAIHIGQTLSCPLREPKTNGLGATVAIFLRTVWWPELQRCRSDRQINWNGVDGVEGVWNNLCNEKGSGRSNNRRNRSNIELGRVVLAILLHCGIDKWRERRREGAGKLECFWLMCGWKSPRSVSLLDEQVTNGVDKIPYF